MAKQHIIKSGEYAGKTIEQLALIDYPYFLSRRKFLFEKAKKGDKGDCRFWPEVNAMDKLNDILNSSLKEEKCDTPECDSLANRIWVPYNIIRNGHTREDYNFNLYELHCVAHWAEGQFKRFSLDFNSIAKLYAKKDRDKMQSILLKLSGFYQDNSKRRKTVKEAYKFFDYLKNGRTKELF